MAFPPFLPGSYPGRGDDQIRTHVPWRWSDQNIYVQLMWLPAWPVTDLHAQPTTEPGGWLPYLHSLSTTPHRLRHTFIMPVWFGQTTNEVRWISVLTYSTCLPEGHFDNKFLNSFTIWYSHKADGDNTRPIRYSVLVNLHVNYHHGGTTATQHAYCPLRNTRVQSIILHLYLYSYECVFC